MKEKEITVDPQLLIDALQEQRNSAQNAAALAMARSVHFQQECGRLMAEKETLHKELEVLRGKQNS